MLERRASACWDRGAMWQGAHVSILRQLTGALVASIYHGRAMCAVRGEVDLRLAVPCDVGPLIGQCLRGSTLVYPATNPGPGPGPSEIRRGISGIVPFAEAIKRLGIHVVG